MRGLIVIALLVAGCANPAVEERKSYLSQFVGQPVEAVVLRMGAPTREADQDGHHFVTYIERRQMEAKPVPVFGPMGGDGVGNIRLGEMIDAQCETTFDVVEGTVRGYRFRGTACGLAPLRG